MKKIIFILTIALISMTLSAQKQSTELKSSQLPQITQNYIKDNLPGCQISRSVKLIEKGKVNYYVIVDVKGKKNLFLFDGSGAFLKRGDAQDETKMNNVIQDSEKGKQIAPTKQGNAVQPASAGGTKTVAQPATTGGTKTLAKPATVQPVTSGSTQQTGVKELKKKDSVSDKKPAKKSGTGDLTPGKK